MTDKVIKKGKEIPCYAVCSVLPLEYIASALSQFLLQRLQSKKNVVGVDRKQGVLNERFVRRLKTDFNNQERGKKYPVTRFDHFSVRPDDR
jgi:hypothetical protein